MTYVAQFLKHYPNPHQSETDGHHDEVCFKLTVLYIILGEDCLKGKVFDADYNSRSLPQIMNLK